MSVIMTTKLGETMCAEDLLFSLAVRRAKTKLMEKAETENEGPDWDMNINTRITTSAI